MSLLGVSVIICCYNSRDRIAQTLFYLSQQKTDEIPWEIIIVNNNSIDDTVNVCKSEWEKYNSSVVFRIVEELKPGLSNARLKGISEASYEYLIFCDDDNWLEENYVKNSWKLMGIDDKIGVLGGIGYPVTENQAPYWFERYQKFFALGPQALSSGDITFTKGYVYGAGMVIRKKIFLNLYKSGFPQFLSGRTGKKVISGDDNEICYGAAFLGYKIYYNDTLKFRHYIPNERLNLSYIKKFRIGQAQSYDIVKSYERLHFSKGVKRRKLKDRLKEYDYFSKQTITLLRNRKSGKVDKAAFVFIYYNLINILKQGLFDYNKNVRAEKRIYEFFLKAQLEKKNN